MKIRIPAMPLGAVLRRGALAYLIVWTLSPPLAFGAAWRVLAVLAMGTWIILDLRSARSVILRPNLSVLATLAFVIYVLVIEFLIPDDGALNLHFPILIMLFFLLVGESFRRGREGDARFCFWLILALLPIWSITTLRSLESVSGDVARTVTRSSAEALELAAGGVGGFGFVYTVLLCLPFIAHLALKPQLFVSANSGRMVRRASYALVAVNFMVCSALLVRAGYSIALLLAALGVVFVLLIRSRRLLPFAISLCASALLLLVGYLVFGAILETLQNVAVGTEYSAKLRDIQATLEGGRSTGTVEWRTERYMRSLRLWLENPVLGTLSIDNVGKHSAVLDRFAQYGTGAGLVFLCLLTYVPLAAIRDRAVPIGLALGFLTVAVWFPMLNNVFISWGLALFVFSRGAFSVMGIPLERPRRVVPGGRARA